MSLGGSWRNVRSKFGGRGFIKWIQDYKICAVEELEFDDISCGGSLLDRELLLQDSWSQRRKFEGDNWNFKGSLQD